MRRLGWVQRLAGTGKPGGNRGGGTSSHSPVGAWPFAFCAWPLPFAAGPFFLEWPLALLPFAAGSPKGIKSGFITLSSKWFLLSLLLLNRIDLPVHDHGLADAARVPILLLGALINAFRQS